MDQIGQPTAVTTTKFLSVVAELRAATLKLGVCMRLGWLSRPPILMLFLATVGCVWVLVSDGRDHRRKTSAEAAQISQVWSVLARLEAGQCAPRSSAGGWLPFVWSPQEALLRSCYFDWMRSRRGGCFEGLGPRQGLVVADPCRGLAVMRREVRLGSW